MNSQESLSGIVRDAVVALEGIPSGTVHEIETVNDVWGIREQGTGIGVCLPLTQWAPDDIALGGDYGPHPAVDTVVVVIVVDSPGTGISGLALAWDLAAIILGDFAGVEIRPGIRLIDLGSRGSGRIQLFPVSRHTVKDPNAKPGEAGSVAVVLTFKTSIYGI